MDITSALSEFNLQKDTQEDRPITIMIISGVDSDPGWMEFNAKYFTFCQDDTIYTHEMQELRRTDEKQITKEEAKNAISELSAAVKEIKQNRIPYIEKDDTKSKWYKTLVKHKLIPPEYDGCIYDICKCRGFESHLSSYKLI